MALLLLSACRSDRINSDPACLLRFSADTLRFDTLFAERGSVTRLLKVYNDYSNRLEISSVVLHGKSFRVNIDGVSADSCGPVFLNARDSLLVYVQSLVEDASSPTPYRVTGDLSFSLNCTRQPVLLEAWGQSARRVGREVIDADTTWGGALPYLVFDTVTVLAGATLTIEAGTTVYFTNRGGLNVYGSLRCEGTLQQPVVLRGDRSDYMNTEPPLSYDLSSGQWRGIRLHALSDHLMQWTEMRNASYGLVVEGASTGQTLLLDHCKLCNTTENVLWQQGGEVTLRNCLLYNAGENVLNLEGGSCRLTHCTLANYYGFSWSSRSGSALRIANYQLSDGQDILPSEVTLLAENSIVCGSWINELAVDDLPQGGTLDYQLQSCLLNKRLTVVPPNYSNCIFNGTPDFLFQTWEEGSHPFQYDFHLTAGSSAIGVALKPVALSCPIDLDGMDRTEGASYYDIGCYAYR